MTLANILSTIPAIDTINVQDSTGSIYQGSNQNFRATCVRASELLDKEVDLLRPFNNVLIIAVK